MTTHTAVLTGYAEFSDIDEFESVVAAYRSGDLDEEEFRSRRLRMGCYGIRESDTHMIRVKVPGGMLAADHLDALADVADRYSRGFGHITTRQNFQFHFVELDNVAAMLRRLAEAGMTTREACGNTIRNVTQSPLAGIDPDELIDTRPIVDVFTRYFIRQPHFQDLPRKFKVAFEGSTRGQAQLGIHDLGVLAALGPDGEPGFRLLVGGGLGTLPRQADLLEDFTPADRLLSTADAILHVFNENGPRKSRARARMKFLLDKWGIERFRDEVFARRDALELEKLYPQLPVIRREARAIDAPLPEPAADVPAHLVDGFLTWRNANVFPHDAHHGGARFAAAVTFHLGDVTSEQFRRLAKVWRDIGPHVEVRTTIRQNLLFTNLDAAEISRLYLTLRDGGMDLARAEKSGDVVSCPGAETCNLALTASRGLADAVTDALMTAGLAEVEDLRINISGCPNACGQHTTADLGFAGMARRDPTGSEAPGYRVFVGAHLDGAGVKFGHYIAKVPAKKAPDVAVELVGQYATQRAFGESFAEWVARVTPEGIKESLARYDWMPTRDEDPSYYQDWGDSRQFAVILGRGECAT